MRKGVEGNRRRCRENYAQIPTDRNVGWRTRKLERWCLAAVLNLNLNTLVLD